MNTASGSYSFLADDMDGQSRSGTADVGADELSTGTVVHKPLNSADVGISAP
ncbi:hypothetical protein [Streptomyces sp. SM13]|uniref:hypothetical protein n=1 Tax=Streptomyces sp. SM13 TaxID=1983803 RepID=UPI0015E187A4|nr:hypothetical protein [Streptomyces sp. SM13]